MERRDRADHTDGEVEGRWSAVIVLIVPGTIKYTAPSLSSAIQYAGNRHAGFSNFGLTRISSCDTLPVVDGLCWSSDDTSAGIYLVVIQPDGSRQYLSCGAPEVQEFGENLVVKWQASNVGEINLTFTVGEICISAEARAGWGMEIVWIKDAPVSLMQVAHKFLYYLHEGFPYTVECISGMTESTGESSILISPDNGVVRLAFGDKTDIISKPITVSCAEAVLQ